MRLKKFVMMALMSLLSLSAYADVTVTGIVVEAGTNDPIIGASVVEKGRASNGVATDVDGAFTLTLPSYDSRIVVTYVGMKREGSESLFQTSHNRTRFRFADIGRGRCNRYV